MIGNTFRPLALAALTIASKGAQLYDEGLVGWMLFHDRSTLTQVACTATASSSVAARSAADFQNSVSP